MAPILYKLSRTGSRALSSPRITSFRRTPPPRPPPHSLCPVKYQILSREIPLSSRGPDSEQPFNGSDKKIIVCGALIFLSLLYKAKKAVYRIIESDSPEDLDNLFIYLGLPK